jgi:hypothetical protein
MQPYAGQQLQGILSMQFCVFASCFSSQKSAPSAGQNSRLSRLSTLQAVLDQAPSARSRQGPRCYHITPACLTDICYMLLEAESSSCLLAYRDFEARYLLIWIL